MNDELITQFEKWASQYTQDFIDRQKSYRDEDPLSYEDVRLEDMKLWFMESF